MSFQSTPAIADGRTSYPRKKSPICASFNPRPPSLTGEQRINGTAPATAQFQSTPAIADGRTVMWDDVNKIWRVSIHARHR